MQRRVVVTGATGFIGWHLAERLRNSGWDVRGTVRPERPRPLPDGVEPIAVSLYSRSLAEAFRGAEVVVHLAGLTRATTVRRYRQVNVVVTDAVARAACEIGARLIHVSSQAAAGPAPLDAPPP